LFLPFPSKPLNELKEEDLANLIRDQVPEGIGIDYKSEIESRCLEFAKDVSAFANSRGGYLVYGVVEDVEKKLPKELKAVLEPGDNIQTIQSQFHSWAQVHIKPRVTINQTPVRLKDGGYAYVVEVPRSWGAPHEVSQDSRFYLRNQNGKDPMNVDQLREAFGLTNTLIERARAFRKKRLDAIRDGDIHVKPFAKGPVFVIHFIPFGFSSMGDRLELKKSKNWLTPFGSACSSKYNLGGICLHYGGNLEEWYQQINRDGTFEYVRSAWSESTSENGILSIPRILELAEIIKNLNHYTSAWGISGPYFLCVSLLNCKGSTLFTDNNGLRESVGVFEDVDLILPEQLVESLSEDAFTIARPSADSIWNAAGNERCTEYDSSGKWRYIKPGASK
jgi:Putative DNA-binding domain